MDYGRFQVAVVRLAGEGTALTTANVVSRLRVEPEEAQRHLDRMAKEGRIDIEVDAREGVVYRVRGLSVDEVGEGSERGGSLADELRDAAVKKVLRDRIGAALGLEEPARAALAKRRKISVGVLAGGVVPGLGLAYAAPWKVVAVATVVVVVGWKVLAFVSLMLAVPFILAAAVISAILGGLYTWQFNLAGRRVALSDDPEIARRLPSRLKL